MPNADCGEASQAVRILVLPFVHVEPEPLKQEVSPPCAIRLPHVCRVTVLAGVSVLRYGRITVVKGPVS